MIRQVLFYLCIRAGNGVLGIVMLATYTRLLSAEEYGRYAITVAGALILSATCFGWINVAVNRFFPSYRNQPEIIGAAAARGFYLSSAIAGVICLLVLIGCKVLMMDGVVVLVIFVLMTAQGWYDMALQVANAQGSPVRYGLLAWTRAAISLGAGSLLIIVTGSAYGALAGLFVGTVAAATIFNSIALRAFKQSATHQALARQLFEYGFPLTLTFLSMLIVGTADRLLIGWLQGPSVAAPYAAAYDLVQQATGALMSVLFLAAFPRIVTDLDQGEQEVAIVRTKMFGEILVCVGVGATLGLCILSNEIAAIVFGAQLKDDAAKVIPIIAVGVGIGSFKSFYLDLAFQLRHVTKIQAYVAASMAVLNILLNVLLIPAYGIVGSAWATLISFLFGAVASRTVGKRIYDLPFLSLLDLVKILGASMLMWGVLRSLSNWHTLSLLTIKILMAASLYGACLLILNFGGLRSHLLRSHIN